MRSQEEKRIKLTIRLFQEDADYLKKISANGRVSCNRAIERILAVASTRKIRTVDDIALAINNYEFDTPSKDSSGSSRTRK